nr:hypothetical protein [Tanacetum cinerariifolium]
GINVDSCVCPICSTGKDEINHILFRCDLAQQHGGIYGGLGTASFLREFFPDVPRDDVLGSGGRREEREREREIERERDGERWRERGEDRDGRERK